MLSHIRKGTAWQPLARTLSGLLPQEQSQDDWQHLLQKASGGGGWRPGDGGGQNWSSGEMNVSALLPVRSTRSASHRSELSVSCFIPVATHTA